MGKIKTVSAAEVLHRMAGFLKELEAQGRFNLQAQVEGLASGDPWPGLDDMVLICRGVRSYAFKHADLLLASTAAPSILLSRFADIIGNKACDDKIRVSDKGYARLGKIVQAMQAWCRRYLQTDLLRGRPIGLTLGNDGKLHPID